MSKKQKKPPTFEELQYKYPILVQEAEVMEKPLPVVDMDTPIDRLTKYINKENGAVLTRDDSGAFHILTKYDVLSALGK